MRRRPAGDDAPHGKGAARGKQPRYLHRQTAYAVERAIPEAERAILLNGFRSIDEFFTRKAEALNRAGETKGE